MKKFVYVIAAFIIPFMGVNCYATGDSDCYDIEVVFARGSGGKYEDTREYFELKAATETIFYDYGYMARFSDLDYPATDMSSPLRLLGAFVSAGRAYEFGRSVRQGVSGMKAHYRNISWQCPGTKWVLIGYSQGAMVMADAVKTFDVDSVLQVMMFGDPETYLPEGAGLLPDACMRANYSAWRRYVPECRTYQGVFGGRKPYEVAGLKGKYSLWCNQDDYICGSSHNPFRNSGHTLYAEYMNKDFRLLLSELLEPIQDLPPEAVLENVRLASSDAVPSAKIEEFDNLVRLSWDTVDVAEKYLLLRLNGVDLGYVEAAAGEIEIRDIDWSENNDISLVLMSEDGELGEVLTAETIDERSIESSPVVDNNSPPESVEEPSIPDNPAEKLPVPEESNLNEDISIDNNTPSSQNEPEATEPEPESSYSSSSGLSFSNSWSKIGMKSGLSIANAADLAKIMLSVLSAASILVVFLIRRR